MDWIAAHILLVTALGLSAAGVFCLLPRRRPVPCVLGWLLTLAGIVSLAVWLAPPLSSPSEELLFFVFGGGALLCGVLMITSRNPVYGALWFALVTLCVCGLFLLQSAAFLAAATVIVYAGAIVVTFLFIIMLAQQSGLSLYDQRSQHPLLATIGAFILLGALLATIETSVAPLTASVDTDVAAIAEPGEDVVVSNPLSQPRAGESLGTMQGLGRSLFGDYLFAVELAGTLLMIASIGAIVLAPRKEQVTR